MTAPVPPRVVLASLDEATVRAAVKAARSWRQVGRTVGLPASRHSRRLRSLCDDWEIDYSHFRYHMFTDQQLVDVLTTATSWAEALPRLGYAEDSGSARATIRKHARRLGLPVPSFAIGPTGTESAVSLAPFRSHLRTAGPLLIAASCTLAGYQVSWPLEPAPYDLLVDTGTRLLRVQVKTSTRRVQGSWNCAITRSEYADVAGGKRRAWYSPDEIDVFAIIDGDGQVYWIPVEDVSGQATLALRRYGAYRVPVRVDLHDDEAPTQHEGPAPSAGPSELPVGVTGFEPAIS